MFECWNSEIQRYMNGGTKVRSVSLGFARPDVLRKVLLGGARSDGLGQVLALYEWRAEGPPRQCRVRPASRIAHGVVSVCPFNRFGPGLGVM